jgi:hypothetical protein
MISISFRELRWLSVRIRFFKKKKQNFRAHRTARADRWAVSSIADGNNEKEEEKEKS